MVSLPILLVRCVLILLIIICSICVRIMRKMYIYGIFLRLVENGCECFRS